MTTLARRLGPFDATMIVMGGIIGSGIFINPSIVARHVQSPPLILGAWLAGGVIAMLGAFAYAELAALRPAAGGQYVYLRDAWHPAVAFLYGWGLLLIVQSGGMAAVAVTFAKYFKELTSIDAADWLVAAAALLALTVINCRGVRAGATTQNVLMMLKLAAIGTLVVAGALFVRGTRTDGELAAPISGNAMLGFAAAMTPVMFAYGGWQTASFVSGELKRPRHLVVGLIAGVSGVAIVYLAVNAVCLHVLGAEGLAATMTPATAVMRQVMGDHGARLIAAGIAVSTIGFLSQSMLTAPRVYYAMARDRVFFDRVGHLHPRTQAPVIAIALQGLVATAIAVSGTYDQILSYVVATDFLFFGLTGLAIFVFRRRGERGEFRTPGHPLTTVLFTSACWIVAAVTVVRAPSDSFAGLAILLAGLPVFTIWRRRGRTA